MTVAITVRNDRAGLDALLPSLVRQTRTPDELAVVDAFSTDGTWELVSEFAKTAPFPVVAQQLAGGRGAGRTRCVELATGDLVAFIDSDCVVRDDWLERYERAWSDESAKDLKRPLGAIGGASHTPPGSTDLQWAIDDVMSAMEEASFHGINTINCCYLREAVVKAGLFDDALHTAEDPDLNARIAAAGYRLARVDNDCFHKRRETWRKLARQHYEYGKGAVALLKRYPSYFPTVEKLVAPIGALLVLGLVVASFFWPPALILLVLGLALVPLYVHRRLVGRAWRAHGLSGAWLRRLGVAWMVYVPYQLGILAARLGLGYSR